MSGLTPEQIAALLRGENIFANGQAFTPEYARYDYASPESGGSGNPTGVGDVLGFSSVDPNAIKSSRMVNEYDTSGNLTGQRGDTYTNPLADVAKWAAMAFGLNGIGDALTGGLDAGLGADAAGGLEGGSGFDAAAGGGAGGMSSADKLAMLGDAGYGSGMSGFQTGLFDTVNGLTGSPALASVAAGTNGNSLLSTLGSGLSQVGSGVASALGGAGSLAGLLGAAAGAQPSGGGTTTNERKLDPRLDSAIFGQGGLLGRALDWSNTNASGMNDTMRSALDRQKMLLGNPRVWGGLSQVGDNAMGLLNQPVAGNIFANWRG